MAESKVSLKLLIDTKSKSVLFAEAGKDFVDFIFHILAMPLATAIRFLGKQEMVGCLGKLYESVENLNDKHILQGKKKEIFLKPKALNPITSVPLSMLTDKPTHKIYYSCNHCNQETNVFHSNDFGSSTQSVFSNVPNSSFQRSYSSNPISSRQYSFSDYPYTPCPTCSKIMTRILTYVAPPPNKDGSNEGGFVKDETYIVMDDLVIDDFGTS
ncbi:uncharacterized protein Fot_31134 [Forsythia ovata]|uniref:Uncharacterized protein n=1 Tax=Forsythia ovata TaxID=205694 RepID=A0ABD1T467_9LAMI